MFTLPSYLVVAGVVWRREYGSDRQQIVEHLRSCAAARVFLVRGRQVSVEWSRHDSTDSFWEWLSRVAACGRPTWIVLHGALESLGVLGWVPRLDAGDLALDTGGGTGSSRGRSKGGGNRRAPLFVAENGLLVVRARLRDGRKLLFVDLQNWLRAPLSAIACWCGLPAEPLAASTDTLEAHARCALIKARITLEAVLRLLSFLRGMGIRHLPITVPAIALHLFRTRFRPAGFSPPDLVETRQLERNAYYGGRVEARRLGPTPGEAAYVDATAQYVAVMRDKLLPLRILSVHEGAFRPSVQELGTGAEWLAQVVIATDEPCYPLHVEGYTVFPVGEFETWLPGPELEHACKRNRVVRVLRAIRYQLGPTLHDYADWVWRERVRAAAGGNALSVAVWKLIGNALYGKLAQRSGQWEFVPGVTPLWRWGVWCRIESGSAEVRHYRSIAGVVQERKLRGETDGNWPAIAAWITSHARLELWRRALLAGLEEVYYLGVDGLLVSTLGVDRLRAAGEVDSGQCGLLRIHSQSRQSQVLAAGWWRCGNECRSAGVPTTLVDWSEAAWARLHVEGFGAAILRLPQEGCNLRQLRIRRPVGTRSGIVQPDNWVRPFVLPTEWDLLIRTLRHSHYTSFSK